MINICPSCSEDSLILHKIEIDNKDFYALDCDNPFSCCIFSGFIAETKEDVLAQLKNFWKT